MAGSDRVRLQDALLVASVFEGPSNVPQSKACKVVIKDTAVPKSFPARRLPLALHEPVRRQLASMVESGTIEEVKDPSDWCSPMVVATKKSGDVRICELQISTVEEIAARVDQASSFTKLDCANSFWPV